MKATVEDISIEIAKNIVDILNKGNSVEVKKVKDEIVVVELQRKVKIKSPING